MVNSMFLSPGLSHGIGRSSRIDDEVVQDKRQRDDNNLQDVRQDQSKEEEVEPRSYKWIFKKKIKSDDTIDKYKARLVIKRFRQREGLDFFDTYFPVARITSIRMILAIAALRKLEVHQMDMKMTFLNGNLENVLYMNQPEGLMAPGLENKVCRLVKSCKNVDLKLMDVFVIDSIYVLLCLYIDGIIIT
ncbi:retrotransposon protein, putative, ty1-copia subclass [Tanacetum coccineum]